MTDIYHIVCNFNETHEDDQLVAYMIFEGGVNVTDDYKGEKPDLSLMDQYISHGICKGCLPVVYEKNGIWRRES